MRCPKDMRPLLHHGEPVITMPEADDRVAHILQRRLLRLVTRLPVWEVVDWTIHIDHDHLVVIVEVGSCACLNDQVIFLTGGGRTLPMPNLMTVTVEQADAMVARLRDG